MKGRIFRITLSGSNEAMRIMNLRELENRSEDRGSKMVAESEKGIRPRYLLLP
jgi:hypothetical protein